MKDAIGGVLSLNLILIFLVIISCYLAFSVNYTKAFRVKNEIRSIIEKNEGLNCKALEQINTLMDKSNYELPDAFKGWCRSSGYIVVDSSTDYLDKGGFCYKAQLVNKYGTTDDKFNGVYYTIVTFTSIINMPMFGGTASDANGLMKLLGSTFAVKGETSIIYSSGVDNTDGPTCGFHLEYGDQDANDVSNGFENDYDY